MPLDFGSLAPIMSGSPIRTMFVIASRVTRYAETLTPEWNAAAALAENPEILTPSWGWSSVVDAASGYPKSEKIHPPVRSAVKLIVHVTD